MLPNVPEFGGLIVGCVKTNYLNEIQKMLSLEHVFDIYWIEALFAQL